MTTLDIEVLRPRSSIFFAAEGLGVANEASLWNNVAQTRIMNDEVEWAEERELVMKSGKRVRCDAVIAATGWENTYPMFNEEMAVRMGLPMPYRQRVENGKEATEWNTRLTDADKKVLEAFPRLSNLAPSPHPAPKSTPARLYRNSIPIRRDDDRSIAFVGTIGSAQSLNVAEVQALWAAAYFSQKLALPSVEKMEEEVALATAWRKRRYLNDEVHMIYEHVQYISLLLRDLGINDSRKGGGWKELLSPYESADFRGILDEWRKLRS